MVKKFEVPYTDTSDQANEIHMVKWCYDEFSSRAITVPENLDASEMMNSLLRKWFGARLRNDQSPPDYKHTFRVNTIVTYQYYMPVDERL